MKKSTIGFVTLIILITIILLVNFIPNNDKGNIKIGADFALSGSVAVYGEWASKGVNLALEEINKGSKKLEIIYEDNKGQPKDAVTAYNKLRNIDHVDYVLTFQSSVALAIAPLANQDKVIQIDVSATTPDYSTPNDYTFRTGIVATQLAKESSDILFNKLGIKEVGILSINNDFGEGMKKVFKENYQGKIIAEEKFNQDASDFKTQLNKLSGAKTIFLVSHLKESGLLVKQAAELKLDFNFFTDVFSVEGPDFIDIAKESAEEIVYVAPKFDIDDKNQEVSSFIEKYRTKYNEEPTYFAAQAYDAVLSLSKALENCSDTDCVREELMKLDFNGASGKIKFDVNGDVQKPISLKTIKYGEFIKLE